MTNAPDIEGQNRPLNEALRLVGPDQGPDWRVDLLWDDGQVHPLMEIHSDDPTAVGMIFTAAALQMGLRLELMEPPRDGFNTTVVWACGRRDRFNVKQGDRGWHVGDYGCACDPDREHCQVVEVQSDG